MSELRSALQQVDSTRTKEVAEAYIGDPEKPISLGEAEALLSRDTLSKYAGLCSMIHAVFDQSKDVIVKDAARDAAEGVMSRDDALIYYSMGAIVETLIYYAETDALPSLADTE